jgi:hypothetical protein
VTEGAKVGSMRVTKGYREWSIVVKHGLLGSVKWSMRGL